MYIITPPPPNQLPRRSPHRGRQFAGRPRSRRPVVALPPAWWLAKYAQLQALEQRQETR
jgi:hypothetical protein